MPRQKLLGKLSSCAWTCLKAEVQRVLGRRPSLRDGARVVPGMIAAIQAHGELLHYNPHFHMLLTSGAFTPQGEFVELPELDIERLEAAWQEAVFALYLAEDKIEPEVVEEHAHLARAPSCSDGRRPGAWTSRCICPRATSKVSSDWSGT